MANQFSKAKIDFDVYQKADPASQINFGEEAKVISDAFKNVATEREGKKAALEKAFQDQQAALNDLGEYDNPTAQQVVMNAGQDGANKLLDMKNMMKRGLVKPADVTMFQQNQLNGFNLLKKNMGNFDKTFQEYTTRLQENMEGSDLSQGAPAEQWLAKQLEGFANMNNVSVQTDPETGNVSMLRLNEDGTVDKNSSATLNRLTLLMKQKVNNFDPNKGLKRSKAISGKVIQQQIDSKYGLNAKITTEERSRMETEYYNGTEGQKYLDAEAQSMLADPYDMQSFMLNSSLTTEDGTAFEIGDQQAFDKWNTENPDNESNNPYLVMEFGADNQYNAQFTDAQKEIALDAMKTKITGTLDYKKEEDVKGLVQKRAETSAETKSKGDNENAGVYLKNVDMVVSGTAAESDAGAQNLIDDINKNNPNAPRLTKINRNVELLSEQQQEVELNTFKEANPNATAEELEAEKNRLATEGKITDFTIKVDGQQDRVIDAYNADGTLKSGQQLKREIYEKITPKGATKYDIAEKNYDGDLSRGAGNTGAGGEGVKDKIVYKRINVTKADGEEVSPSDYLDTKLGSSLDSYNDEPAQVEEQFNALLDMDEIMPRGLEGGGSLKIVSSGDSGEYKGVFTIGGQEFIWDDIYGEGDSVQDIVNFMQDSIETAVNNQNSGTTGSGGSSKGAGSKYN